MKYYIYHIPGKKIGVTQDLKRRVEEQQGYHADEYDIIMESDDINLISEQEVYLSIIIIDAMYTTRLLLDGLIIMTLMPLVF